MEYLKFPIGQFITPDEITKRHISQWINEIEGFPEKIIALTEHLSEESLSWKYRPEGWTIRQVVHHCTDSHMNSFIRFKLALTEESPKIRPYHEDLWAELADYTAPIDISLALIKSLHLKWAILLRSLSITELEKTFIHPEHGQTFQLNENIGIYAWHGNHHLSHIKLALENKGTYN